MIRIVLLGCDSLLSDGLFSLLKQAGDIDVQAFANVDEPALLDSIAQVSPEVVMFNVAGQTDPMELILGLFSLQQIMHLRVFGIRPDNNNLMVYSKTGMVLAHSDQLLEMIRQGVTE